MILIVKLLNFIKRLWQCSKWIPDLYKYTGNCLKFAFLSVLKEHNVLPASYFQNLHFIIFGYPVYTMEYFNISFFEFSFLIVNQMRSGTFLFSHFSLLSISRFTCSHFFLALMKQIIWIIFFSNIFRVPIFCISFTNYLP